jgi:tRNA A37 threonylcarbamoyladenosine biosynthesis protein TsaE
MGLIDLWGEKTNIVVIEWAEKIKNKLPKTTKYVYFDNLGEDTRKIVIKNE